MCLGISPPKRSILKWWNNPLARRKYENALYMYERMKHFFTEKIPCVRSKIYYIIQAPLNLRPRNITFGEENYINLWLQEHSYERPCVSNCFAFFFIIVTTLDRLFLLIVTYVYWRKDSLWDTFYVQRWVAVVYRQFECEKERLHFSFSSKNVIFTPTTHAKYSTCVSFLNPEMHLFRRR